MDVIIFTCTSKSFIKQFITRLNLSLSLKDVCQLDYLDIEVHYLSNDSLLLSQSKNLKDLLIKANMASTKGMTSPMASSSKLSKVGSENGVDPSRFRSIVGALQYATITRPVFSFVVNKVCQFLSIPLEDHYKVVKGILRYL